MGKKGTKGTDEAFYKFLQVSKDAILKMVGIERGDHYEIQTETLKARRISPDVLAVPQEGDGEVVFIEFQGYRDPFIRHRLTAAISFYCFQKRYSGPVLPVIFYTASVYFKAALPLVMENADGSYGIRGWLKEIVLEGFKEEELLNIDSRLVVLAPFTVPKTISGEELVRRTRQWGELVRRVYAEDVSREILDIMALFLLSRFRNLSREEVISMLHFDLADTVAGQDIFKLGEQKGLEKGLEGLEKGQLEAAREMLLEALEARFEWVPEGMVKDIQQINHRRALKGLIRFAVQAESLETFRKKLDEVRERL